MNEWVWDIGGMILTGEKWSSGRETLAPLRLGTKQYVVANLEKSTQIF
jgi:hypothetical protein